MGKPINEAGYLINSKCLLGELKPGDLFVFFGFPPISEGWIRTECQSPPQNEQYIVCRKTNYVNVPNGLVLILSVRSGDLKMYHCQCAVLPLVDNKKEMHDSIESAGLERGARPNGCDSVECQQDIVCRAKCPESSLECTLLPQHYGDHIACGEHPLHNLRRWKNNTIKN